MPNLARLGLADRFSGYFLPVVGTIAALTFLIRRDPLATAAVLVVACSCSLALATPIAMLASVGAAAKRGLLIKGGKYLETLARADVLLIDKTGTLTLGKPRLTDVIPLNGMTADTLLALAASAERYSEHPLAEAVRAGARAKGLALTEPRDFVAVPGEGVRALVDGCAVAVGNRRMVPGAASLAVVAELEAAGKRTLLMARDGEPVAVFAASDAVRPEVPAALAQVRALGIRQIELLIRNPPVSLRSTFSLSLAQSSGITQATNKIHNASFLKSGTPRVAGGGDGAWAVVPRSRAWHAG